MLRKDKVFTEEYTKWQGLGEGQGSVEKARFQRVNEPLRAKVHPAHLGMKQNTKSAIISVVASAYFKTTAIFQPTDRVWYHLHNIPYYIFE